VKPFEAYLRNLRQIRFTGGGVPETSYDGVLETLLMGNEEMKQELG